LELDAVSRAQSVWAVSAFVAAALAVAALSSLPFSFWVNGVIAGLAFCLVAGSGYRYFLKHATPEEILEDLDDRKNSPG
jgi:hypothetical protein